jgi:hypothetical protein
MWRKTLGKIADTMFSVPAGSYLWPAGMHETLKIALLAPLLPSSPWSVQRSEQVDNWTSEMCNLPNQTRRPFLSKMREFWLKKTW